MPRPRVPERETPQLYSHRDLRSDSRRLNRLRKQSQKYYQYRGVHPSWVGQKYLDYSISCKNKHCHDNLKDTSPWIDMYVLPVLYLSHSGESEGVQHLPYSTDLFGHRCTITVKTLTWTKGDMWTEREQGIYPLDRRHHISKRRYVRHGEAYSLKDRGKSMKQKYYPLEWDPWEAYGPDWYDYDIFPCLLECCNKESEDIPLTSHTLNVYFDQSQDFEAEAARDSDSSGPATGLDASVDWVILRDCSSGFEEELDTLSDIDFDVLSLSSCSSITRD